MFSSGRLALVLVLALIVLGFAGVLLPQEGKADPSDILKWREGHPAVSAFALPLGLFRVFHSVPFLAVIVLLAVNTLCCTLRRLFPPQRRFSWKMLRDARTSGFLGLHISLLLLMGGGFHSGATRMDGYVILTEGQELAEDARSYVMLVEGPLRRKAHRGFGIRLVEVADFFGPDNTFLGASAGLEFAARDGRTEAGAVRANHPVSFLDVAFTLDETGFSPRLAVRKRGEERVLADSYIALKTFRQGRDRDYRDYLALPGLDGKIFMRFLPDAVDAGSGPVKRGDKPGNTLLHFWTEDEAGRRLEESSVRPGGLASLAGHEFTFLEFRRWAGFRVVQDSGYGWILAALWLGLAALVLRYVPDLKGWFSGRESEPGPSKGA